MEEEKYKVVDLFAGAGGFGLGFELSNFFDIRLSLEKDKWAADTLRHNRKINKVIEADIKDFSNNSTIKESCTSKPNVIIGGPPCQGFSIQGIAKKKDINDPRNSLFEDFANWVDVLAPDIFLMENVKGILSRKNAEGQKVIEIIKNRFRELGYSIQVWLLNAAEYGVPQLRERVFIVGSRPDIIINKPKPTHCINGNNRGLLKAVTVGEAIDDLPKILAGEGAEKQVYNRDPRSDFQIWARGEQRLLFNHVSMNHSSRIVERYKHIQNGSSMSDLIDDFKVRRRNGNGELSSVEFNSNYRHLKHDQISYTIPASFYSSFIHPELPRNITAREAARIQSFPDWYVFKGKRTVISSKLLARQGKHYHNFLSQYNQIGNAVPPVLAMAMAKELNIALNRKYVKMKESRMEVIDT